MIPSLFGTQPANWFCWPAMACLCSILISWCCRGTSDPSIASASYSSANQACFCVCSQAAVGCDFKTLDVCFSSIHMADMCEALRGLVEGHLQLCVELPLHALTASFHIPSTCLSSCRYFDSNIYAQHLSGTATEATLSLGITKYYKFSSGNV